MLVILIRDIYIQNLFFPKGSTAFLDKSNEVAYAQGTHFDIEREDYETLQ